MEWVFVLAQFIKYIPLFYLHRLLRMFPLLAAAVLLQASLLHRLGDGPQWASMAWAVQTCRSYWWSALLHIQNFTNVNEMVSFSMYTTDTVKI